MNETKKAAALEKKNEESSIILNKNILFKECNHTKELKDTFVNIKTDYSLESEKEKNNISLFSVLKKKLKDEKRISRFLIIFKMPNNVEQKIYINETLKFIRKEEYKMLTGICLFVNIYSIMLLESGNFEYIVSFIKKLNSIKYVTDVNILYFNELNNKSVNDDFHFYKYDKEPIFICSNESNYIDQVWELYINVLNLCCFIKNNKEKKNIFDENEKIKKDFSLIQNLYHENAKQYIWNLNQFVSFFVEDFKLPKDDFFCDFLDF